MPDTLKSIISLIGPLTALLEKGECGSLADTPLNETLSHWCYLSTDGKQWMAGRALISMKQELASTSEAVAALLAGIKDVRRAWRRVLAARFQESGRRKDLETLANQVTGIGKAAKWIEKTLLEASLEPTGYEDLERLLLGCSADMPQAAPRLSRILSWAAALSGFSMPNGKRLEPLSASGLAPNIDWCDGRLLNLPGISVQSEYVLSGDISMPADSNDTSDPIHLVLHRPWIYLMAQIAYVQDNWRAEQITGSLLLELPREQQENFIHPIGIKMVVSRPTGEETVCGTLGEFVLRILNGLGVQLLQPAPANELDRLLAPVLGMLLKQRIWRFYFEGGGLSSRYTIDPDFADSCGRRLGSRTMYRLSRRVSQTIRLEAEGWGRERLATAGLHRLELQQTGQRSRA